MPGYRSGFALVAANGKLYAIGGNNPDHMSTALVEMYDPLTDSRSREANMNSIREWVGGVLASNGRIYVGGAGYVPPGGPAGVMFLNTVEEYDPATYVWRFMTKLPYAVGAEGIAALSNGRFYLIGGVIPGNQTISTVLEATIVPAVAPDAATSVWIGLRNSDDQGTQLDLRTEIYKTDFPSLRGNGMCHRSHQEPESGEAGVCSRRSANGLFER
jgi:hypothetical protein